MTPEEEVSLYADEAYELRGVIEAMDITINDIEDEVRELVDEIVMLKNDNARLRTERNELREDQRAFAYALAEWINTR